MQEFIRCIEELADQISSLSEQAINNKEKAFILTYGIPKQYRMNMITLQEINKFDNYQYAVTSLINEKIRQNKKQGKNKDTNKKIFYTNQRGNNQDQRKARSRA